MVDHAVDYFDGTDDGTERQYIRPHVFYFPCSIDRRPLFLAEKMRKTGIVSEVINHFRRRVDQNPSPEICFPAPVLYVFYAFHYERGVRLFDAYCFHPFK
jgi:hypothetical protein